MLVPRPAGALPPAHAIRRVRAPSFSTVSLEDRQQQQQQQQQPRQSGTRRFTTVSAHASAPARPTLYDARPYSRRASMPTANSTASANYVAPSKPKQRQHKSIWHSPTCTWSRQLGPRDENCPGCAKEVASSEPSDQLPYEFSPREAVWQQHLNDMKDFIQRDPYEAMFGFSNRLLKGQGLPQGWWERERRPRRKAEVIEPERVPASTDHARPITARVRKDSGVEVLEASYSWSSSGYDTRTGESWSRGADMVYDPIEGKMVPVTKKGVPPPKPTTSQLQSDTGRHYDSFENQQHQAEADALLERSLDAFDGKDSRSTSESTADKPVRPAAAKQALEQSWVAEKKNSPPPCISEETASAANAEFPGNSILSSQQREWERNAHNAERATTEKEAQKTSSQSSMPNPQAWKDFKAGKVAKPAAKPQLKSPLYGFTIDNGSRFACMSILRKEKPLRHMTMRELSRHRAAVIGAFEKRTRAAEAAKVSSPADERLNDEVKQQKLAMTAWESKWRGRKLQPASKARPHTSSSIELSSSAIAGEGDIDAKVVDFCTDSAGWYKKPAPHAVSQAEKDKLAADALVDEMRHIYESAYGAITVSHRQGAAKLDDSLKDFDEMPPPEELDLALREFEAIKLHEELDSALNEFEEKSRASDVDDALKVYEREPQEGLDHALRQFEKHGRSPKPDESSSRTSEQAKEAASVITSWEPKVVQRLEPAIDRLPLNRAAKRREAEAAAAAETEVADEFSYEGEQQKFAYDGDLESCSSRSADRQSGQGNDHTPDQLETHTKSRPAPWGVNPARRARNLRRSAINPIDGTTAPRDEPNLTPQTGNFASPTGFVNHDVPATSSDEHATPAGLKAKPTARKVRRVEEVFSGAQPLQRESIPQIVEHFRRLGLGPELEAYARSSALLDRSSSSPSSSSTGSASNNTNGTPPPPPPGSRSDSSNSQDEQRGRRSGRRGSSSAAKAVLLTIPTVMGAMYAAGVVVEYFREQEDARRRRSAQIGTAPVLQAAGPDTKAEHEHEHETEHEQRAWGPVMRTSALRRRREAAAAAQRAAEAEAQQVAAQQALAQQQAEAQAAQAWQKLDDDLRTVGRTLWAGVGAAAAAIVLICSLGNGGS